MHDANELPQHMTLETVEQSIAFFNKMGAHVATISGGEPTEHPHFTEIVDMWIANLTQLAESSPKEAYAIEICSNGSWINNAKICLYLKKIVGKRAANFTIHLQITSIKGLYSNYDTIQKYKSKLENAFRKFVNINDYGILNMQGLGRAREHDASYDAAASSPWFCSCVQLAQLLAQTNDLKSAILLNEGRGHFCQPLVDWQGKLHISESCLCPACGHITDEDIEVKAHKWRPCGGCVGFKKLLSSKEPAVVYLRHILGCADGL